MLVDLVINDRFWHFSFAESCVVLVHNVHLSTKEVQSVNCRLDKATKAWLAEASVHRRGNTLRHCCNWNRKMVVIAGGAERNTCARNRIWDSEQANILRPEKRDGVKLIRYRELWE